MVDAWWVTGLVDGEGCFYARIDHRTKTSVRIEFQIGLVEADRDCLEKVKNYFGVGRIYRWDDKRPKAQPKACYRVQAFKELKTIISHFQNYPLQSKERVDFDRWVEIVNAYSDKDFVKVSALVDLLRKRAKSSTKPLVCSAGDNPPNLT
jgi:hypothetical protein